MTTDQKTYLKCGIIIGIILGFFIGYLISIPWDCKGVDCPQDISIYY